MLTTLRRAYIIPFRHLIPTTTFPICIPTTIRPVSPTTALPSSPTYNRLPLNNPYLPPRLSKTTRKSSINRQLSPKLFSKRIMPSKSRKKNILFSNFSRNRSQTSTKTGKLINNYILLVSAKAFPKNASRTLVSCWLNLKRWSRPTLRRIWRTKKV
jgi:hypothetical protein